MIDEGVAVILPSRSKAGIPGAGLYAIDDVGGPDFNNAHGRHSKITASGFPTSLIYTIARLISLNIKDTNKQRKGHPLSAPLYALP